MYYIRTAALGLSWVEHITSKRYGAVGVGVFLEVVGRVREFDLHRRLFGWVAGWLNGSE